MRPETRNGGAHFTRSGRIKAIISLALYKRAALFEMKTPACW
jgi:hypothetical protein